jgi:hypothetical protein
MESCILNKYPVQLKKIKKSISKRGIQQCKLQWNATFIKGDVAKYFSIFVDKESFFHVFFIFLQNEGANGKRAKRIF